MPRKRQEAIFIGAASAEVLKAAAPEDRAYLTLAILEWAQSGIEPEIPAQYKLAWAAIRYESVQIAENRKADAENGRRGGNARVANQAQAKASQGKPKQAKESQGNQEEKRREENIPTSDDARAREGGRDGVSVGSSGRRSSVEISQDFPSVPPDDPVDEAMEACLTDKPSDRRCFGRLLQRLGPQEFLDVVRTVAAEFGAGEVPANRAATMNSRLQARLTVVSGIGGVAK